MMMMLHHDRRNNRSKIFVLTVVGIIFLYIITRPVSLAYLSQTFGSVITPLAHIGNSSAQSATGMSSFFTDKKVLIAENNKLKDDILSLSLKLSDRDFLAQENKELKQALGREDIEKRLLASVLTRPSVSPYGTLLLDVGAQNGVKMHDKVVSEQVVLGEIIKVNESVSLMKPYATAGEEVSVLVGGAEIVPATTKGRGQGNYVIELPRDTKVSVGDIVSLGGINHYIIGSIEHIDITPNDPFKRLFFKAPVSLSHVRYVDVILDSAVSDIDITNTQQDEKNADTDSL